MGESSKKVESVKLGKVSINPKTLVEAESLLRPLGKLMPQSEEERKTWRLDFQMKDAHFDVAWAAEEDSRLLVGIYLHGLGSWEQIKSDKSLELSGKILLNASCKPQEKHLDVRAAYLLRMLKRNTQEGKEKGKAAPKKKTVAANEEKETEDDKKKKDKKSKKKDSKKKAKPKTPSAPVHIGSSELSLKSDLDSDTFAQCKEKMRAVKKSLKALDKPDPNQTQEEQVANTRRCLVKIGKHIDILIGSMEEEKARDWRNNLWLFVSNFTDFDARKLFKLYRHAMKKDGSSQEEKESSQEKEERKERKEKTKHKKKKAPKDVKETEEEENKQFKSKEI